MVDYDEDKDEDKEDNQSGEAFWELELSDFG